MKVKSKNKLRFGFESTSQSEKSHVGNDRGPLHPFWLSLHLWEGNLDGCYQNESEERPILRAINIEANSAEKVTNVV